MLTFLVAALIAQSKPINVGVKNVEDCDGSTMEMRQCGSAIVDKLDTQLKAIYQKQVSDSGAYKNVVAALKASQIYWLKYRDQECLRSALNESAGGDGSIFYVSRLTCLQDLTRARIKELSQ